MTLNLFDKTIDIDYILFLDIDGVLNVFGNPSVDFEQESIYALNELYDQVKYKIVLSSSWKESWPIYYLQEMFSNLGIKAPLIDVTKTFFDNEVSTQNEPLSLDDICNLETKEYHKREYEIKQWVRTYQVEHYLILDDYTIKDEELEEHFVWTLLTGLTRAYMDEMVEKLKR